MTTDHTSLSTESASLIGKTLFDVGEAIAANYDLGEQVYCNLLSSLRTLCKVLGRHPKHVPVALNLLRIMMDNASPGAFGVGRRRWANVRSDVVRAVKLCGYAADFIPEDVPIAECWEPIVAAAPSVLVKSFVRRFARFCSARQIVPADVNDDLMPKYLTFLKDVGSKAPETCRNDMIRNWNLISSANSDLGLKPLTPITRSRSYTRTWNELPATLATDAAAFKAFILHVDFLSEHDRRAVRQSTADQYERQIRRLASACLANGANEDDIANLGHLVSPATLRRGITYFASRNGNKVNQQIHDMAHLALLIAASWSKLPEAEITELKRLASKCKIERKGLTQKNLEGLRQFRDHRVIEKLIQMPEQMMANARRLPPGFRSAMLAQSAVAIAIFLNAPMRIANLRSLDRARHFVPLFSTKEPGMQLVLSKEEVKNAVDLQYPLAESTMDLVETYMEQFQPYFCGEFESSLLFPGRDGKPKSDKNLRQQITTAVRKHMGIRINPHLFRHLCAMIFLEAEPGAYEDVRRMLGHKSIQTTTNFYSGLETAATVRRYNDIIAPYRAGSGKKTIQ